MVINCILSTFVIIFGKLAIIYRKFEAFCFGVLRMPETVR